MSTVYSIRDWGYPDAPVWMTHRFEDTMKGPATVSTHSTLTEALRALPERAPFTVWTFADNNRMLTQHEVLAKTAAETLIDWPPSQIAFLIDPPKENAMSNDAEIEQEIQAKGLTAPRVTPADLEAEIIATDYHVFPGTMLTVCCLTLKNGFTVIGESACASPANFNKELGEKISRNKAVSAIWPLLGFRLRDQLAGT